MLGIRIDPYDCPIKPALVPPDFCVEKDLDPITDLEGFAHLTLILSPRPDDESDSNDDHNAPVDCPLGIASHVAARQDIDSLQKKCASGKDDEYADDA